MITNPNANTGSSASTQAAQPAPAAQMPPQQPGQTGFQQPSDLRWSFHNKAPFGRSPIGRGIGSEALRRLQAALTEEYKEATNTAFEVTLIPVDNSNEKSYFSALVVCLRDKTIPKSPIAFHTLIIEATGTKIPARNDVINLGNNETVNVEVVTVASDSYDQVLMNMIEAKVAAAFPGITYYNALATVVPRSFNFEDKVAIHKLALNAGLATATELETRSPGFVDINLANHVNDSKLIVNLNFSKNQIENGVGEPVRADVNINFTSQQTQWKPNQSLNSDDRATSVANLTGFIDLVWAPVVQQNPMYPGYAPQVAYGQQMAPQTQQYAPRLIIDSIESDYANTAPAQLLALVAAMSVGADGNWMQALWPVPQAGKKVDMHDIGAIGIEVMSDGNTGGFGKRIDTGADTFRPESLGQLISALIRPGLILSIDVPEHGAETWYTSIFSAASNGTPEAVEALYNAANHLTNGHFARYFNMNKPMFTDLGNRVHLGYYFDELGVKRDIRDIDYLAVANKVGVKDPKAIRDWSDTFTKTNWPLALRLSARKKTIMGILPNAEITGFAHRVTFEYEFLEALSKACSDAGLRMIINAPINSGDITNQRGVANYVSGAMMPMAAPSVFNQTTSVTPGVGSGYGMFTGRWK